MDCVNERPNKKLIRSKSGLRIVVADDEFRSPFVISEPEWTPDKEVSNCKKCCIKFGFTTRKHHCRRCGHIYCASCCDERLDLPRMCFIDPVRICDDCAPTTIQENKFFDIHLKTLMEGAYFFLNSYSNYQKESSFKSVCDNDDPHLCKLSQDHRYLIFDVVSGDADDVSNSCSITRQNFPLHVLSLNRIKNLHAYNNVSCSGFSSMELEYLTAPAVYNDDNEYGPLASDTLTFSIPGNDELEYKQSSNWIMALQQALKLMLKTCESSGVSSDDDDKKKESS